MPQFSTTHRVRHSAADMFDLIADVERYPEFVPLCRLLTVRKRIPEYQRPSLNDLYFESGQNAKQTRFEQAVVGPAK